MEGHPHSVGMIPRRPHCSDTTLTNIAHHGHVACIRVPRGSGLCAL